MTQPIFCLWPVGHVLESLPSGHDLKQFLHCHVLLYFLYLGNSYLVGEQLKLPQQPGLTAPLSSFSPGAPAVGSRGPTLLEPRVGMLEHVRGRPEGPPEVK